MIRHNGIEIDRKRHAITYNGKTIMFTSNSNYQRFRMWEALIFGPITREQLFEILWGDDFEGGPNGGLNVLSVKVAMWAKLFASVDLKWVSEKRSGIAYWSLVPINVV